jgi:hypothetical protein
MVSEDQLQVDPKEFPIPFMVGGPKPTANGSMPTDRGRQAARPSTSTASGVSSSLSPSKDITTPAVTPLTEGSAESPQVPAADASKSSKSSAGKKPSKPVKIDPSILERLLKGNAGR